MTAVYGIVEVCTIDANCLTEIDIYRQPHSPVSSQNNCCISTSCDRLAVVLDTYMVPSGKQWQRKAYATGAKPPKCHLAPTVKHIGQELIGELCNIFKF